jgi:serine/threonine protein kinase
LIFHFLLQEYYKRNNFKKLIHLCNLFEFGYIENTNENTNEKIKLYAIMENCGLDLTSYKIDNNKKKYEILLDILKILYQCCKSLELIHERGYLHLDIKLENFMINNNIIKIIDFGFLKKNNSIIKDFLTEPAYTPNDLIVDSRETKKFTYHHDIFSLGCMFIYIIYLHIFNEKKLFMICPLNYDIKSKDDIFNKRKLYNIKDLNFMIEDIKTKLKEFIENNNNKNNKIINLIIELIPKLVSPDPIKRYQSVKDIKDHLIKFQDFESNIKNNEEKEIKKIQIFKRINNN